MYAHTHTHAQTNDQPQNMSVSVKVSCMVSSPMHSTSYSFVVQYCSSQRRHLLRKKTKRSSICYNRLLPHTGQITYLQTHGLPTCGLVSSWTEHIWMKSWTELVTRLQSRLSFDQLANPKNNVTQYLWLKCLSTNLFRLKKLQMW